MLFLLQNKLKKNFFNVMTLIREMEKCITLKIVAC